MFNIFPNKIPRGYIKRLHSLAQANGSELREFSAPNGNKVYSYINIDRERVMRGVSKTGEEIREVTLSANKVGSSYSTIDFKNKKLITGSTSIVGDEIEFFKKTRPLSDETIKPKNEIGLAKHFINNKLDLIIKKITEEISETRIISRVLHDKIFETKANIYSASGENFVINPN